ncbi:Thioredoxin-like superfamily [Arabidopsis thaliana x Arabidopsis arenosa]|uniref:Thioredoxin-like superfamily n=1 Tax=Arabidopsis thaliana x Arabidopsis arenosa TaxID=1240361 RepID=A0A8T2CAB1_9BRAS|nr:Thioredoxin-like superfamily [Arabidopsis thaliana x Arabidopsis arenosa]
MEQIRVLHHLVVMVMCLVCLGFHVGMCSESDRLIKTYVSSSLSSNDDLVYSVQSISEWEWDSLVLQSKIPVMVLFKTTLCPTCRLVQLEMDVLDFQFKDRFQFYTIDVNKANNIQERYEAFTIPTTIVFIGGDEVDRVIGYQPGELRNIVNKYT